MSRKRVAAEEAVLVIDAIGARGDGIARHHGEAVYIPFTAPGDRARVRLGQRRGEGRAGELVELLQPGARATPRCPHFGVCGGCALQHLAEPAYVEAKTGLVTAALRQHGLVAGAIAPLERVPPGTRRRARFAVQRPRAASAAAAIGFMGRASHRVADMTACAVLHPALVALAGALRQAASRFWPPGAAGAATATLSDTGIDLLLDLAALPDLAMLEALAAFAEAQDLARLSWRAPDAAEPTPAAIRRPPRVILSGVPVELPPDAFLQASVEAEAMLVRAVLAGIGAAERVVDLHAGLGTFSFALAQRGPCRRGLARGSSGACRRRSARRHSSARRRMPRSRSPAASAGGAGALRCRGVRPAARRRQGSGGGTGALGAPPRRRRFLQPRELRPRCTPPRRGRLPAYTGAAGRPVSLVAPCRAGSLVRAQRLRRRGRLPRPVLQTWSG
jgi:23S rRNA (uracil1939-C5)-methyltransferase